MSINVFVNLWPVTGDVPVTGICGSCRRFASNEIKVIVSYSRHEDFCPPPSSILLRNAGGPPLDSEMGWTGKLWSKTNLLKWQNKEKSIYLLFFFVFQQKKYIEKFPIF